MKVYAAAGALFFAAASLEYEYNCADHDTCDICHKTAVDQEISANEAGNSQYDVDLCEQETSDCCN